MGEKWSYATPDVPLSAKEAVERYQSANAANILADIYMLVAQAASRRETDVTYDVSSDDKNLIPVAVDTLKQLGYEAVPFYSEVQPCNINVDWYHLIKEASRDEE
ncbi:hypothetical protein [Aureibacillus halotolerans]|uniref:Uncharacterized protein n=1 Tax=Aureibacillus halotolerans TaxID=1508390 RepID=A0A4R6U381_9BACI|nr:hypothetical protein [Aureibacillus halotolerans]TDQ39213.1 hypothetical protein EV213_108165 [Aureibacillus halotolerans]